VAGARGCTRLGGSIHFITLQGSHLNTLASLPPGLTGGICASSRITVVHFSQFGGAGRGIGSTCAGSDAAHQQQNDEDDHYNSDDANAAVTVAVAVAAEAAAEAAQQEDDEDNDKYKAKRPDLAPVPNPTNRINKWARSDLPTRVADRTPSNRAITSTPSTRILHTVADDI
jgi:hypothetical protein